MTNSIVGTWPCTWLVEVPTGHPEPDSYADTVDVVECGAPTSTTADGGYACENGHEGDDPEKVFTVDIEGIAIGVSKVVAAIRAEELFLDGNVLDGNRDNDAGDFDAFAADAVVQFAALGEVVYG